MAKFTWLGDEDPSKQSVNMFGVTFVKGESTDFPDKREGLEKLKGNPMFSTDSKAETVEAKEPEAPDVEAGTEKAALKDELRRMGVTVQGNPSLETLRDKLAAAHKKAVD